MRALLIAVIGAIGVAAIMAAVGGSPTIAAAEAPLVKCFDCEGNACHVVYGAASQSCVMTGESCIAWGDCG